MKTRLLNGLEDGLKDEVKREYLSTSHLRKRITDLMEKDIEGVYQSMRDETNYGEASWPFHQAEKIGEIKALKKLISLLE